MDRKKTSDAVQMIREIRDQHYEQTKDMTPEERVAFYREKAEALDESLNEQEADSTT